MEIELTESRELIRIATELPANQFNPLRQLFFPVEKDRPTYGHAVDIEVRTLSNTVASLQSRNQKANVVGKKDVKVISIIPPHIREKVEASPKYLRSFSASGVWNKTPEELQKMRDESLFDIVRELKTRAENRIAVMACQLIQTGAISYAEDALLDGTGGYSFSLDLAWQSNLLPVLAGGALWSAGTAVIADNLATWGDTMASYTVNPNAVVMGASAFSAFASNTKIQGDFDRQNWRVGTFNPVIGALFQGTYQGLEVYKAPAYQYKDETGSSQYLYDPKKVTLFNKEMVQTYNEVAFGLVEEVGADVIGEMYFSKQWETEDPSTIWTLLSCCPLPIIPIEGSVLTATVLT